MGMVVFLALPIAQQDINPLCRAAVFGATQSADIDAALQNPLFNQEFPDSQTAPQGETTVGGADVPGFAGERLNLDPVRMAHQLGGNKLQFVACRRQQRCITRFKA